MRGWIPEVARTGPAAWPGLAGPDRAVRDGAAVTGGQKTEEQPEIR